MGIVNLNVLTAEQKQVASKQGLFGQFVYMHLQFIITQCGVTKNTNIYGASDRLAGDLELIQELHCKYVSNAKLLVYGLIWLIRTGEEAILPILYNIWRCKINNNLT